MSKADDELRQTSGATIAVSTASDYVPTGTARDYVVTITASGRRWMIL